VPQEGHIYAGRRIRNQARRDLERHKVTTCARPSGRRSPTALQVLQVTKSGLREIRPEPRRFYILDMAVKIPSPVPLSHRAQHTDTARLRSPLATFARAAAEDLGGR
jgi:hypothetical protein